MIVEFPQTDAPLASVIVLAWQSPLVLPALEAVAAAGARFPFEVIVVLNGASPAIVELVESSVRGVHLVRSGVNLGFAGGCNRGSRVARGRHLVFLNDDTEVAMGWLDSLVSTAETDPSIGAVGSRLIFPDGSVQESGSVVFRDGSTLTVGRNDRDEAATFAYRRQTDYCSACGLLVRRSAWDLVGGFHEGYFPGYYEDVDLCLTLAAAGLRVVYEPTSRIVHHESGSTGAHYKAFVFAAMKEVFVNRWAAKLAGFVDGDPPDTDAVERAVQRAAGDPPRVLIIDDRLPDPDAGSGFTRMYWAVADMAAAGWAVTCAATDRWGVDPRRIGALGVRVVGDLEHHLALASSDYEIVVISRPNNVTTHAAMVRGLQPRAWLIYDAESIYHRRIALRFAIEVGAAQKASTAVELESIRDVELGIATEVDQIVCVSDEEAGFFRATSTTVGVTVVRPASGPNADVGADFETRRDLLFVASWLAGGDSPNADGLRWFVAKVLPKIRARMPWVRLLVTGGSVPPSVQQVEGPSVRFLGQQRDLGSLYRQARVAIVPIRFGAGIKNKTVEALSFGLPVVSTTCGAEGIPDVTSQGVTVADDAIEYANAILELLADPSAWRAQRAAALASSVRTDWLQELSWPEVLASAREQRVAVKDLGQGTRPLAVTEGPVRP